MCKHGDVRLIVNTASRYTFLVEEPYEYVPQVCFDGRWAEICYDETNEVQVNRTFCQQFQDESRYRNRKY